MHDVSDERKERSATRASSRDDPSPTRVTRTWPAMQPTSRTRAQGAIVGSGGSSQSRVTLIDAKVLTATELPAAHADSVKVPDAMQP